MQAVTKFVVGAIIVGCMIGMFFADRWARKRLLPRQSPGRLLLYIVFMLLAIVVVTGLMVWTIHVLFPAERMR